MKSIPGRGKSIHSRNGKYRIASIELVIDSRRRLGWKIRLVAKTEGLIYDRVSKLGFFSVGKGKSLEDLPLEGKSLDDTLILL